MLAQTHARPSPMGLPVSPPRSTVAHTRSAPPSGTPVRRCAHPRGKNSSVGSVTTMSGAPDRLILSAPALSRWMWPVSANRTVSSGPPVAAPVAKSGTATRVPALPDVAAQPSLARCPSPSASITWVCTGSVCAFTVSDPKALPTTVRAGRVPLGALTSLAIAAATS